MTKFLPLIGACTLLLAGCQTGAGDAYRAGMAETTIKPDASILRFAADATTVTENVVAIRRIEHKNFGDLYERWLLPNGYISLNMMGPRRMTRDTIRSPREFIEFVNKANQEPALKLADTTPAEYGQNKLGRFFYTVIQPSDGSSKTCLIFAQAIDGTTMAGSYIHNGEGSEGQVWGIKCRAGTGPEIEMKVRDVYLPILSGMSLKIL
jgi:hypothetical protein